MKGVKNRVIEPVYSFLKGMGVETLGLALTGSRISNNSHKYSDYDFIVISNISRKVHVENFFIEDNDIQLIIFPILNLDMLLSTNFIAGNGITFSMFNNIKILSGEHIFSRITKNKNYNFNMLQSIEKETINRNLSRLRKKTSNLIKDLENSKSNKEDIYTSATLLTFASQLLLSKKSRLYQSSSKHLCRDIINEYGIKGVDKLLILYTDAINTGKYDAFIEYIKDEVLDNSLSNVSSSSYSCYSSAETSGTIIMYLNTYNKNLILKLLQFTRKYSPQILLNQAGDLMHIGYFFIIENIKPQSLLKQYEELNLNIYESRLITFNYQMDFTVLKSKKRYNIDNLLIDISTFTSINYERNILMNTTLDWMINLGAYYFNKESFQSYTKRCFNIYNGAISFESDKLDISRLKEEKSKTNDLFRKIDLSVFEKRFDKSLKKWGEINRKINSLDKLIKAYDSTIDSTIIHSVFDSDTQKKSNFFYLFESIFESMLIKYTDRALIYYVVSNILKK